MVPETPEKNLTQCVGVYPCVLTTAHGGAAVERLSVTAMNTDWRRRFREWTSRDNMGLKSTFDYFADYCHAQGQLHSPFRQPDSVTSGHLRGRYERAGAIDFATGVRRVAP